MIKTSTKAAPKGPLPAEQADEPRPRQKDDFNKYHRLYKRQKRREKLASKEKGETR